MISLSLDTDGKTWVYRHQATPPLVYLDTWALMDVAESHADAFANVLLRRGGTLMISWAVFVELSRIDSRTAAPLCSLFGRVFPSNVAFMQVEAGAVIARENDVLAGKRPPPAMLHLDWLEVFTEIGRKRSLDPLDPEEFMELVRDSETRIALDDVVEKTRLETEKMIEETRGLAQTEPKVRKRLDLPLAKGGAPCPATRFLYFEVMRHLLKTKQKTTRNHLLDFWHTVVPTAYCAYVVLDLNWALIARQAQQKVRGAGRLPPELPEAAIYSDLDLFLSDFGRDGVRTP